MGTPKSTRRTAHLKKLKGISIKEGQIRTEDFKTFVLGISGGDCAGKNEMIQYMFDRRADKWFMKDTKEEVTILRQKYFAKAKDGKKYTA